MTKTGDFMLNAALKAASGGELTGLQDLQAHQHVMSLQCVYFRRGHGNTLLVDTGCCEM